MPALIAALSTAIINSLGRIAAFLFSWAMVGFFGKMPPKRQYLLAGIGLMSMLWIVFAIGIFKPGVIDFLFLLNKGLQNPRVAKLISQGSLALVFGLPFLIGLASLFVDAEPPATFGGKIKQIGKGWIIAPGFAIGMVLMMLTSVITLAVTYLKRLKTEHVPIKIKEGGYDIVMRDLKSALDANGFPVRETEMPWFLKPPVWVMGILAKSIVQGLVTPGARMLQGEQGLSVVAHPTDLFISGPKMTATQARAIITQRVPFTDAYLTWEEASQKFEDRITALWRIWKDAPPSDRADDAAHLQKIEELKEELHGVEMPFDQWEVVYRELLQLQDEIVSGRVDRGAQPLSSDTSGQASGLASNVASRQGAAPPSVGVTARDNGKHSLPVQEIAIIGALLGLYLWWTRRDAGT